MASNQARMEYWAVRCFCGEMIPLSPRLYGSKSGKDLGIPSEPELFEATCEKGHKGVFAKTQVISWLGPAAIGFRTNHAFQFPAAE